jgi:hypothetical protein
VAPSPVFHVYELGYNLYGEGGGLYTALTAGGLSFVNTLALAVGILSLATSSLLQQALIYHFAITKVALSAKFFVQQTKKV